MWYPQLRDKRPRAYRLQLPSAAHSRAQKHSHVMEHTGYIALPSAAHSGAQKRSHVHGTPSCATSAQEHTGYIVLPSAAHSGAQKHSHVMVPLAARQAPKSVPVTS